LRADAGAIAINKISEAIRAQGRQGQDAISLNLAEKYVEAFSQLAKEGNTVIVPSNVADA
jgi:hypothetical protein